MALFITPNSMENAKGNTAEGALFILSTSVKYNIWNLKQ